MKIFFCALCDRLIPKEADPDPKVFKYCDPCKVKINDWLGRLYLPGGVEIVAFLSDRVPPGSVIYIGKWPDGGLGPLTSAEGATYIALNPRDYIGPSGPKSLH